MKLMPSASFRFCPACDHRWWTASPAACVCPKCSTPMKDASSGWPHSCPSGHGADHGGECEDCAEVVVSRTKTNGVHAAVEWKDRTP